MFAGAIERVLVDNVSLPVIERDFWIFERCSVIPYLDEIARCVRSRRAAGR